MRRKVYAGGAGIRGRQRRLSSPVLTETSSRSPPSSLENASIAPSISPSIAPSSGSTAASASVLLNQQELVATENRRGFILGLTLGVAFAWFAAFMIFAACWRMKKRRYKETDNSADASSFAVSSAPDVIVHKAAVAAEPVAKQSWVNVDEERVEESRAPEFVPFEKATSSRPNGHTRPKPTTTNVQQGDRKLRDSFKMSSIHLMASLARTASERWSGDHMFDSAISTQPESNCNIEAVVSPDGHDWRSTATVVRSFEEQEVFDQTLIRRIDSSASSSSNWSSFDALDEFKDQGVAVLRDGVEEVVEDISRMMSVAVLKGLTGVAQVDQELCGRTGDHPARIEAGYYCGVNAWIRTNTSSFVNMSVYKNNFVQKLLNSMVVTVKLGLLPANDGVRITHGCASMLGLRLARELPDTTLIVSSMRKNVDSEEARKHFMDVFSRFGNIVGAARAPVNKGFGFVRFEDPRSTQRALRKFRSSEIVVNETSVWISSLLQPYSPPV